MPNIETLTDAKTGEVVYPQTLVEAISDADGNPLTGKLPTYINDSTIQSIVSGHYVAERVEEMI